MRKIIVRAAVAGILCTTASAWAGLIANPQNLNLLEWYGVKPDNTVGLLTQVTGISSDAPASTARNSFDGGHDAWANLWAGDKIRYTLPQAVTVDKFYLYMGNYASHPIEDFTIRYSDTIDWTNPNWSTLASNYTPAAPASGIHTSPTINASMRYIELTVGPNLTAYQQLSEFMLLPAASAAIDDVGRNLLADPYTSQNFHTTGTSPWNTTKEPDNAGLSDASGYWQVNFGAPKQFNVMTFSWYPGQGHNNVQIWVSNDGTDFGANPIWTGNGNTFQEAIFDAVSAQYIRVTADYAGGGALNDIHVFNAAPIPEPAALGVIGLVALMGLKRRR